MTSQLNSTSESTPFVPAPDYNRGVYCLMGIPVDALRFDEVIKTLIERMSLRSRIVWSTPNLNNLATSQTDDLFRDALALSDLSTVDGMPLVLLARMLKIPIFERVAGSSVFERLMFDSTKAINVYFFGGPIGTAYQASKLLASLSNTMSCVGYHSPGFGPIESMSSDSLLAEINRARPDMLILALGTQRGHEWIRLNAHKLDVPVLTHLGSVINFVAGKIRRAPKLMQRLGLEWLWRIVEEPYLAPRYANDFLALLRLLMCNLVPVICFRFAASITGEDRLSPQLRVEAAANERTMHLKGAWQYNGLQPVRDALSEAAVNRANLRLDFSEISHITPELLGLLMLAKGYQDRCGRKFCIVSVRPKIRRLFRLNRVEHLLTGDKS
jgi:N-acetylglucosaminyldiphosphoundecaprenol N-acetyl-beta-D-mannosaminyltransferase